MMCVLRFARPVDLPEVKGNHRKFRTVVASLIGRLGCSGTLPKSLFLGGFRHLPLFTQISVAHLDELI